MGLCQAGPMPAHRTTDLPLHGWTVLSLRPRGQHAGLRAACARMGAGMLALSPLAIQAWSDAATRRALADAGACDIVVFTSPNAVRAAQALRDLAPQRPQAVLAVGEGTRRALQRAGIDASSPARMDSEGVLAMPLLQAVAGRRIGLVSGAGGRDLLAPALLARGADVLRADVYARAPVAIAASRWDAVAGAIEGGGKALLALSSGEALRMALAQCPAALAGRLRQVAVSAASTRLADVARQAGFARVAVAASARPAALLRAAADAFV